MLPIKPGQRFSAAWLALQPREVQVEFWATLPRSLQRELPYLWPFWAREDQLPPEGEWTAWVILGGRGAGKTRAGAEWVRARIEGSTPLAGGRCRRMALVAETVADARDVMVEGDSGLLAISPPDRRPRFEPSKRRLTWPNGAVALLFSAEDPESLRGPQFDGAWADELAKWRYGQETWDMLQFGLRLGPDPRQVVTTTPRPVAVLKALLADPHTRVTRASTYANRANLAPQFFERIVARYEGTRLGRQELEAELLDDDPDALWQRALLDRHRVAQPAELRRIVVAVDPPASTGPKADACGIVAAGLGVDGHGYVLADGTVQGRTPQGWAEHAVALYHRFAADRLIGETNNGGDMIAAIVRQVDATVAFQSVRASHGKVARAEPVAALYEQGRIHHVGGLAALEDQMCAFTRGFDPKRAGWSPDRVDALVWALSALMLGVSAASPRVRTL